jgi:hypothetical protein
MDDYPLTLKSQAESALNDPHFDFIATYHAVADLRRLARQHPDTLDGATISKITRLLNSQAFSSVRQAYFLFREAASVLTDMATVPCSNGLGEAALAALTSLLVEINGSAHRGVAEALGSLPIHINAPGWKDCSDIDARTVTWPDLLSQNQLIVTNASRTIGRSVVVKTADTKRVLVLKLAKEDDTAAGMEKEIRWMESLKASQYAVDCRFHIPSPLYVDTHRVFSIDQMPLPPPAAAKLHPDSLAIAFVAHRDYFIYPNDHRTDGDSACEMLGRNAYLMGYLAARGIIHDAPIPLFHNRTQRLRRSDQGRYQWFRSGRLDRWIDSCAFPNFGLSGLRDFEHLEPFQGNSRCMYRHIGRHLFSLLLVAGSHFRCRDKGRRGLDTNGQPVDARDLFDAKLLERMVQTVFVKYYTGFTGSPPTTAPPVNIDRLIDRMIDEMGVDRYMTELLRRVDQNELTDTEFRDFLMESGYPQDQLDQATRGEKDILITSGPHLGDFNRQISLPELIECVAGMAAVCIGGRYGKNRLAG